MVHALLAGSLGTGLLLLCATLMAQTESPSGTGQRNIKLPEPQHDGKMSVERALSQRRSVREFKSEPIASKEISQVLWAAQGITHKDGLRTAPSAGALFPLDVYLVAGSVSGIPAGIYRYVPKGHELVRVADGDVRAALAHAALDQEWMAKAPAMIVLTAVYERTTVKYSGRGERYVHFEIGHACQNVHLQCEALGLGTVVVGSFSDGEVKNVLGISKSEMPLCIMPIGKK